MQVKKMEQKQVFNGTTGARSVREDLKKHFRVLDDLSAKIDELYGMSTLTEQDNGSGWY
jgi:hypothetical protein